MTVPAARSAPLLYSHRHILGIEGLSPGEITGLLDLSESYVEQNRRADKKDTLLRGRTVINLFFETSTRTRTSFELAAKRLGADVINMSVGGQRHQEGRDADRHGDDAQRHAAGRAGRAPSRTPARSTCCRRRSTAPSSTAATAATSIRPRRCSTRSPSGAGAASSQGLLVAICGDILHSRVARSNIHLLTAMGARVRVIAPPTLLAPGIERLGVEVFTDMRKGLRDCDIVMMLRLQTERMQGSFVPSIREYFHFFGLDYDKLAAAKPDALIMHPGPMNRGVEIDSEVADDIDRSLIREQVEMGVAVRMACLDVLTRALRTNEPAA